MLALCINLQHLVHLNGVDVAQTCGFKTEGTVARECNPSPMNEGSVTVAQKVFCVSRRQSFRETASKWTRHSFLQRCCCLILSLMTTYYHVYVIHSTQQLLPAAAYFFISLLYIFGDYHSNWYLVIARTRAQMWPYKYDNYTRSNMFQQKQREAEGSPAKYKVVLLKPRKVMLKIRFENWNDQTCHFTSDKGIFPSKQTSFFFFPK